MNVSNMTNSTCGCKMKKMMMNMTNSSVVASRGHDHSSHGHDHGHDHSGHGLSASSGGHGMHDDMMMVFLIYILITLSKMQLTKRKSIFLFHIRKMRDLTCNRNF